MDIYVDRLFVSNDYNLISLSIMNRKKYVSNECFCFHLSRNTVNAQCLYEHILL